jgi:hypothetical protein
MNREPESRIIAAAGTSPRSIVSGVAIECDHVTKRDSRAARASRRPAATSARRIATRVLGHDARRRLALACLASFFLTCLPGCSGPSTSLPVHSGGSELPPGDPAYRTEVQVKYLGAGGVVIKRGDDVLLTAPFFSNPSILRVAFGEIAPRKDQIDRFLAPPGNGLAGATAVLVGHAHYDHLMDVPYIKQKYMPKAKIYGSDTMKFTLAGDNSLKPADVESVENGAGTADHCLAYAASGHGPPSPSQAAFPAASR